MPTTTCSALSISGIGLACSGVKVNGLGANLDKDGVNGRFIGVGAVGLARAVEVLETITKAAVVVGRAFPSVVGAISADIGDAASRLAVATIIC